MTEWRDFDFSGDIVTEFGAYGVLPAAPIDADEWFFYGRITSCP